MFSSLVSRVSSLFVTSPNIPVTCPHEILRKRHMCTSVMHRAVCFRLVPRVEDFLKKLHSGVIPTFSSLGNEGKVAADGQAGRAGILE